MIYFWREIWGSVLKSSSSSLSLCYNDLNSDNSHDRNHVKIVPHFTSNPGVKGHWIPSLRDEVERDPKESIRKPIYNPIRVESRITHTWLTNTLEFADSQKVGDSVYLLWLLLCYTCLPIHMVIVLAVNSSHTHGTDIHTRVHQQTLRVYSFLLFE